MRELPLSLHATIVKPLDKPHHRSDNSANTFIAYDQLVERPVKPLSTSPLPPARMTTMFIDRFSHHWLNDLDLLVVRLQMNAQLLPTTRGDHESQLSSRPRQLELVQSLHKVFSDFDKFYRATHQSLPLGDGLSMIGLAGFFALDIARVDEEVRLPIF